MSMTWLYIQCKYMYTVCMHMYIHGHAIYITCTSWWHKHLKHVLCLNKSTCWARCKAVRPGHSVLPNIRLTEAGTDLITILRCSLSFKTVLTSRNITVFKIKFPLPKTVIRVMHAFCYLVTLADMYIHTLYMYMQIHKCMVIYVQCTYMYIYVHT